MVTFLLICNLAIWVIYTFEVQKVEESPVQVREYKATTWFRSRKNCNLHFKLNILSSAPLRSRGEIYEPFMGLKSSVELTPPRAWAAGQVVGKT